MHLVATDDSAQVIELRSIRELARRENDGYTVALFWHPRTDAITVTVENSRTGELLEIDVERHKALDAFYHPFAYDRRPVDDLPLAA
jgi:hypothetical protein